MISKLVLPEPDGANARWLTHKNFSRLDAAGHVGRG